MSTKQSKCAKKKEDLSELGKIREEKDMAVERTREYVRRQAEAGRVMLWEALDFQRRIYGHPKQIRAFTLTYCCDYGQCFL